MAINTFPTSDGFQCLLNTNGKCWWSCFLIEYIYYEFEKWGIIRNIILDSFTSQPSSLFKFQDRDTPSLGVEICHPQKKIQPVWIFLLSIPNKRKKLRGYFCWTTLYIFLWNSIHYYLMNSHQQGLHTIWRMIWKL